jgi:hypothetical protein
MINFILFKETNLFRNGINEKMEKYAMMLLSPCYLLKMTSSGFILMIRTLYDQDPITKQNFKRQMVNIYHHWNRKGNNVAELLTRICYEVVIGKLRIKDLSTDEWRWSFRRDKGHMLWNEKLLCKIRRSVCARHKINSCSWVSVGLDKNILKSESSQGRRIRRLGRLGRLGLSL